MNQFTIKDIENLSGIKAHTWRIWEQRYGIHVGQRKESNHRFYDTENLKKILRISYLYHTGLKISRIAALEDDEIRQLALEQSPKENGKEFYIQELIEASIDLNEEKFEKTLHEAFKKLGVEESVENVIYPFQEKIGVLWLTDHVIPSQEHFTSNIIRQKLSVATDALPYVKETTGKQVLLFTPKLERHEIPLQFIQYVLKKNKNKVIYFGTEVLLETLELYSQSNSFEYMLFYLVTNLTSITPDDYVKDICNRFPDKKILMAGSQVHYVSETPPNLHLFRSIKEMIAFSQE